MNMLNILQINFQFFVFIEEQKKKKKKTSKYKQNKVDEKLVDVGYDPF